MSFSHFSVCIDYLCVPLLVLFLALSLHCQIFLKFLDAFWRMIFANVIFANISMWRWQHRTAIILLYFLSKYIEFSCKHLKHRMIFFFLFSFFWRGYWISFIPTKSEVYYNSEIAKTEMERQIMALCGVSHIQIHTNLAE